MGEAYHNEALRRQRNIDKKHAALVRMAILQKLEEDKQRKAEENYKIQQAEKEKEKARKREEYLSSMGRAGKGSRGYVNPNYMHMLEEQKKRISQKDLRHQEKILRDHCLVMGRVNNYFLA